MEEVVTSCCDQRITLQQEDLDRLRCSFVIVVVLKCLQVKESIIMAAQLASHVSLMAVAQETSFLGASVRPGQVVPRLQSRSLVRRSTTIVSQASKAAEILKRVEHYTTVEKAGIT